MLYLPFLSTHHLSKPVAGSIGAEVPVMGGLAAGHQGNLIAPVNASGGESCRSIVVVVMDRSPPFIVFVPLAAG